MTRPLTTRQADHLAKLAAFIRANGYAPTYRELGALIGLRSTNGIAELLTALERKGAIRRPSAAGIRSRVIVLAEDVEASIEEARELATPPDDTALREVAIVCARYGFDGEDAEIAEWLESALARRRSA